MSTLDIIIGPMFAGKSSFLIKRIRQLKVLKKKYLVIKPRIDTRYANEEIVSHDYEQEKCHSIEHVCDIFDTLTEDIHTILIDEGQFFTDLKKSVLFLLEEKNINIVIVGLDGDSNRNKFGEILDLIPYSNTCTKINALCQECGDGTPGIFSYRQCATTSQISIGGKNEFIAVCRKHYLDYISKSSTTLPSTTFLSSTTT